MDKIPRLQREPSYGAISYACSVTRSVEEQLLLFCRRVESALARRAVRNGTIAADFHARSTPDGEIQLETDLGDDEDVRSLLLEVRKFLSDNEDVHFPRIANLVERTVDDAALRDANRTNRRIWKQALGSSSITLHVNGVNYLPKRCFDIVINGHMFHDDAAKAAEFEHLDPVCQAFVLTNVNALVLVVLGILHAERNLIMEAFDRGVVKT